MSSNKVIVVNGQHLALKYSGGAGRYAKEIYKRLVHDSVNTLSEYDVLKLNFPSSRQHENFDIEPTAKVAWSLKPIICQLSPPIVFKMLQKLNHCFARGHNLESKQNLDIPLIPPSIDLENVRLLHELTNYMTHSSIGRLCLSPNLALAVTFLDIQDYYYPEYFNDDILNSRRMVYSFYKDRADIFFAISDFTKQTMVEKLGINPSKIKVTHLAADDLSRLEPSQETCKWVRSFERFWIYPAKVWKHKNHDFLLKSISKRRSELKRAGVKLLLTGGFDDPETQYLNFLIKRNRLDSIVRVLGFVSDEQLQALLQRAEYLVFPSLFEGFGMPVLEAMSLGCPVVSSNAASLPEVAGDAAVYFNPNCEEEFIDLIDRILLETGIDRNVMIQKGLENCSRFSWDKTYNQTMEIYKEIIQ